MHRFAGLDGDRLRPQLAGTVPRPSRPLPAPGPLRRLEPLAAVFLGLHGVMVLANLGAAGWRWAGVGLVLLLGLAGLGGRGPAWMVQLRALAILVVGSPSRRPPAAPAAGSRPGRSCWSRCTRWSCRDPPGW